MPYNIVIVGGHGNIGLRLTKSLASTSTNNVTSIIRKEEHKADIIAAGAKPVFLDLEINSVSDFATVFTGTDVVYFTAGSASYGHDEHTEKVDYLGAVKVFDAIEAVQGKKPRLILLSTMDSRDPERIPSHYNESDLKEVEQLQKSIPNYFKWKYEADKNLAKRTAFKWTTIRTGGHYHGDEKPTGTATVGRAHLSMIHRDDVAKVLVELLHREDAAGLALDFGAGTTPIPQALDEAIKKGETDFDVY